MPKFALPKETIIAKLWRWGYLTEYATVKKALEGVTLKRLLAAVVAYQQFNRLKDDGVVGEVTGTTIMRRFCNCRDFVVENASLGPKWPHKDVTTHTAAVFREARTNRVLDSLAMLREVVRVINGACGIRHSIVESAQGANISIVSGTSQQYRDLDGPGGVLAFAWLPNQGTKPTSQLGQVHDAAERMSFDDFLRVMLHESLHNDGLSHNTGPEPSIMDPSLNSSVDLMDPWTRSQLIGRYGEPTTAPNPEPPPGPQPGPSVAPYVAVRITEGDGRVFEAEGRTRAANAVRKAGKKKAGVLS